MLLDVANIAVAYGNLTVVKDVSFSLAEGELGCLLGPSGCGKTTVLRAIAGFEPLVGGRIRLGERSLSRAGETLAPERRGVGMVFQDFALFPHLTVADNVGFGLRDWKAADRRARIESLLELVGLPDRGNAYPHQLSGGQQQRIALARAIAPRPRLLLLDEPFSSLDVELREVLARDVRRILKHEGITSLLVTHDQLEAFAMADTIGVMYGGQIVQWDSGYNLYHQPADRFVAEFIGQGVLLPGSVVAEDQVQTELGILEGPVPERCSGACDLEILVRPDDVGIAEHSSVHGEVVEKSFRGAEYLYVMRLPSGRSVLVLTHSHDNFAVGARVPLRLQADHLVMFPAPNTVCDPRASRCRHAG